MASPQIENGYTKIANEILDRMLFLRPSAYETVIILCLIRKTYGYNKKEDWISLSQFSKATNIARSHVCRTLKLLVQQKIVTKGGNTYSPKYRFNKDYEQWKVLPRGVTLPHQVLPRGVIQVLPRGAHTKENNTKEIILASQETLIEKTTTMKKNTFGRYREDRAIDSHEDVINADTGEIEQYKLKPNENKIMMDLIKWADDRKGGKTLLLGKQMKAIKLLKDAKISPSDIKARWIELENTEFHKLNGMDFMSVVQSFDKKPL